MNTHSVVLKDMLKHFRNIYSCFQNSVLMEGVLGFRHIGVSISCNSGIFRLELDSNFPTEGFLKKTAMSFPSHVKVEGELKEKTTHHLRCSSFCCSFLLLFLHFFSFTPHSLSHPLPFPLRRGPLITPVSLHQRGDERKMNGVGKGRCIGRAVEGRGWNERRVTEKKKAGAEVEEKWLGRCEHLRGI